MFSTELSELRSGIHGRQRRQERGISKVNLKAARRYGMSEEQPGGTIKYTYAGITFIYNPMMDSEVTSYGSPDYASPLAGTRCTVPILLRPKYASDSARLPTEQLRHAQTRSRFFRENHASVTSHTVYVVDCSGSMRVDDVNGARCRSDAVWMSLARDGVQAALESGAASITDIVSVVAMGEEATTILRCDPTDWILYNLLLKFREWDTMRPEGPGCYMPALKEAISLMERYDSGKQSLSLVFVSDGKPSDSDDFLRLVVELAQQYGRRLSITCIGIGEDGNFDVMRRMIEEARCFQCNAEFHKATISTASLSKILTNLSSMVAASKLDMTTQLGKQLQVRKNVSRERYDTPDDEALTNEWSVFETKKFHAKQTVVRVWAWDGVKDDFVCLMDPRCVVCFAMVADNTTMKPDSNRGILCGGCQACFICHDCNGKIQHRQKHSTIECNKWLQQRRHGYVISRVLPSFNIAIKDKFFSEGVERLVAKVRYLDPHRNFVGQKMVAKQSRFVEDENSYENRMDYHRQFLRTQALAAEMAKKFNQATRKLDQTFPQITFLEPLVFELANKNGEEVNHLVEDMLEGCYEKFNNNMGFVAGGEQGTGHRAYEYCDEGGDSFPVAAATNDLPVQTSHSTLSSRVESLFQSAATASRAKLVSTQEIVEEDEEEQEDKSMREAVDNVDPFDVIQAFSHFSFCRSKENFIVVDLQGVFVDCEAPKFILTDPAIHSRSKATRISRMNLGRTDRGDKGIATFFKTHICGDTCHRLELLRTSM